MSHKEFRSQNSFGKADLRPLGLLSSIDWHRLHALCQWLYTERCQVHSPRGTCWAVDSDGFFDWK